MGTSRIVVRTFLIAAPLLAVASATAHAFPGANGLIAFASSRSGDTEIYTMHPDGSNVVNITNTPGDDLFPNWSADGAKIVFASNRDDGDVDDGGDYEIYVMNADGSGVVQLTADDTNDFHPYWSPDGSKIVFMSERDSDPAIKRQIYVMNADGSSPVNFSGDLTKGDEQPRWSPDGTKIAFSRAGGGDGGGEVYVMSAVDGSGKTNLTNVASPVDAPMDWAPDGSKILISTNRDDLATYELYSMNPDGTSLVRLTTNSAHELAASWSPDGTKIAFHTLRDGNNEIYSMNADGTSPVNLTNDGGSDGTPGWGTFPVPVELSRFSID